ncbi:MAG: hypothetical protein ACRBDI_09080 [Alphaproteobacteria bacterium]
MNQPMPEETSNTLDEKDFSLKQGDGQDTGWDSVKQFVIGPLIAFGLFGAGMDAAAAGIDGFSADAINFDDIEVIGEMNGGIANLEAQPAPAPAPEIAPEIENNIGLSAPSIMAPS